jgi:hypothetical protein
MHFVPNSYYFIPSITTMRNYFFVDIHCHSSIKAYARSFKKEPGIQSPKANNETSIYYRDKPSFFDKVKQIAVQLTNFVQSDGSSLINGHVCIVGLSFYSQEKAFFANKLGQGLPSDLLGMLATEFGKARIDYIQSHDSYWTDFLNETAFVLQMEAKPIVVNGKKVQYKIARSSGDIDEALNTEELGETLILFVPTMEGLHVMDQVMDSSESWQTHPRGVSDHVWDKMIARARELRTGSDNVLRPAFVTLAHHFWNGLCGHEQSLGGIVTCAVDQSNGMQVVGITEAGKAVIKELIDIRMTDDGQMVKPVLIDIKHMSRKARLDYFSMLDNEFAPIAVPVLCSHGAVNGLSAAEGPQRNTAIAGEGVFNEISINMYDDELLRIESSGGVFGIQLDERRIGSKQALRKAKGSWTRRDMLYKWSRLVWQQIQHVAELMDANDRYAWGIQCLGTDFDGVIDPINGYWTADTLDDLDDYLLKHAYNYLNETHGPCPLKQARNRNAQAEEVVDRIMTGNALNFFSKIL